MAGADITTRIFEVNKNSNITTISRIYGQHHHQSIIIVHFYAKIYKG